MSSATAMIHFIGASLASCVRYSAWIYAIDVDLSRVANIAITQDAEGRYSLNDLHRAAGGEKFPSGEDRHKPVHFFRLDSTQALINEIEKVVNPTFKAVSTTKGRNGGTFVVKELVYAYAMWISPAFHLKVIRAYDAMATGASVGRLICP